MAGTPENAACAVSSPTMPSARRVARASVRVARERGLGKLTACQAVTDAVRAAQWVLGTYGVTDVRWLLDIEREIIRIAYPHRPVFPRAGAEATPPKESTP